MPLYSQNYLHTYYKIPTNHHSYSKIYDPSGMILGGAAKLATVNG